MKRTGTTVAAILAAMAFSAFSLSAQDLVIFHVNDTHSHVEPDRITGQGGVIERAAYADSLRKAAGRKNVLALHAGDFNQGSSYYTVLGGELEVKLMNIMGYDCTALGNHEFDNGIEDLTARVKKLKPKVVCANYDFSSFELGKYVKPYAIVKKGGMKIGVIGLLTDVSSVVAADIARRMHYLDPAQTVMKYVPELKAAGCDMIIVLSHLGYEVDTVIAKDLSGVDLIVGGHSHTDISAPAYVKGSDGVEIPVVQDGCWGLTVGHMNVYKK